MLRPRTTLSEIPVPAGHDFSRFQLSVTDKRDWVQRLGMGQWLRFLDVQSFPHEVSVNRLINKPKSDSVERRLKSKATDEVVMCMTNRPRYARSKIE